MNVDERPVNSLVDDATLSTNYPQQQTEGKFNQKCKLINYENEQMDLRNSDDRFS